MHNGEMESINRLLAIASPWLWMIGSFSAILLSLNSWKLCNLYERTFQATTVTVHTKKVAILCTFFAGMYVVVGACAIAVILAYSRFFQARYVVPPLFQLYQFVSLVTILASPWLICIISLLKRNYLLSDVFPSPEVNSPKVR